MLAPMLPPLLCRFILFSFSDYASSDVFWLKERFGESRFRLTTFLILISGLTFLLRSSRFLSEISGVLRQILFLLILLLLPLGVVVFLCGYHTTL